MGLARVTAGRDLPRDFNVTVEIPANSAPIKYEVDKESGALFVDRFVGTAMHYTSNYGNNTQTNSDDGDPGGTAGLPMMEVLKHQGVVNCCCVVTRYFGGVLLGAGGLVRAYTQGAVVALKAAQVVEMLPSCQYLCEVAYPLWDKVQYALKSLPVQLLSSEFTPAVGFTLLIRQTDAQSVLDTLTRVTDGRIETLLEEESYRAWGSESK